MPKTPVRAPLTDQQLEELRSADLLRLDLSADEVARLRQISERRAQERAIRIEATKVEQAELLQELASVGIAVTSINDLVNTSDAYRRALPILLKHLDRPYSDVTLESIARALAVRDPIVEGAWTKLADMYESASDGDGKRAASDVVNRKLRFKDGLACALSAAVTDANLPRLLHMLKVPAHGESRLLLLSAIRNTKDPRAIAAIDELLLDPQLRTEIESWRKRRRG